MAPRSRPDLSPAAEAAPGTVERETPRLNRPLALLVAATFFMENLDATIIATAAPAIARDSGSPRST